MPNKTDKKAVTQFYFTQAKMSNFTRAIVNCDMDALTAFYESVKSQTVKHKNNKLTVDDIDILRTRNGADDNNAYPISLACKFLHLSPDGRVLRFLLSSFQPTTIFSKRCTPILFFCQNEWLRKKDGYLNSEKLLVTMYNILMEFISEADKERLSLELAKAITYSVLQCPTLVTQLLHFGADQAKIENLPMFLNQCRLDRIDDAQFQASLVNIANSKVKLTMNPADLENFYTEVWKLDDRKTENVKVKQYQNQIRLYRLLSINPSKSVVSIYHLAIKHKMFDDAMILYRDVMNNDDWIYLGKEAAIASRSILEVVLSPAKENQYAFIAHASNVLKTVYERLIRAYPDIKPTLLKESEDLFITSFLNLDYYLANEIGVFLESNSHLSRFQLMTNLFERLCENAYGNDFYCDLMINLQDKNKFSNFHCKNVDAYMELIHPFACEEYKLVTPESDNEVATKHDYTNSFLILSKILTKIMMDLIESNDFSLAIKCFDTMNKNFPENIDDALMQELKNKIVAKLNVLDQINMASSFTAIVRFIRIISDKLPSNHQYNIDSLKTIFLYAITNGYYQYAFDILFVNLTYPDRRIIAEQIAKIGLASKREK